MEIARWTRILRRAGVQLEGGLTSSEFVAIERFYEFRFPPDLVGFLSAALPVGAAWPNWRAVGSADLHDQLAWPAQGILFDVDHHDFWLPTWGPRPADGDLAHAVARQQLDRAPRLIPVRAHRYVPATPEEAGNPVFSVYHSDVIYYGADLDEYWLNELGDSGGEHHGSVRIARPLKSIPFWSELAEA